MLSPVKNCIVWMAGGPYYSFQSTTPSLRVHDARYRPGHDAQSILELHQIIDPPNKAIHHANVHFL